MEGERLLPREGPSSLPSNLTSGLTVNSGEHSVALRPSQATQHNPSQRVQETPQACSVPPKTKAMLEVLEIPRKSLGIKVRYPLKAEDLEDVEFEYVQRLVSLLLRVTFAYLRFKFTASWLSMALGLIRKQHGPTATVIQRTSLKSLKR